MAGFVDAHTHRLDAYPDARDAVLSFLCTSRRSDWSDRSTDENVFRFFGIHPWYADEWDDVTADELMSILDSDSSFGVGEIGLDSTRENYEEQTDAFIDQLSLAAERNRVISVHMVKAENDMFHILRDRSKGCKGIILHSFSGPASYIKPFADIGCYFSISPRLMSKQKSKVIELLKAIPGDRMLIETDAPNYPRSFSTMEDHIGFVASLLGIGDGELAFRTMTNAKRLTR